MKFLKQIRKKVYSVTIIFFVLIFSALAFSRLTARADSLIGFNEGTGSTVHDTSGSASGTITNATWKPSEECLSGPCLYFDSTGDFVSFGNESTYNFAAATDWTIELWFKTGPISAGSRVLVAKYGTAGYKIYMSSDGKLNFGVDDDASWEPDDVVTSVSRYDDNKWHHLVAAKTGTSNLTLYADAIRIGQKNTLTASGTLSNSANFYLGIDSDGSSNGFSGYIDELKIVVASARTADQVKTDYLGTTNSRGTSTSLGSNISNLSSGLVGWWKMDETSGNRADSSGNGNTLTDTNTVASTTGKYGSAGNFIRTNSEYLTISHASQKGLNVSTAFTLSTWVNIQDPKDYNTMLSKTSNLGPDFAYQWYVSQNGPVTFRYSPDGNLASGTWVHSADGLVPASTWTFLTVTFDGSKIHLYKNGAEVTSGMFPYSYTGSIYSSSGAFNLGAIASPTDYLTGYLDEVRVYNRALSPAEVQTLYAWAPGPVGWWKMDENTGTSTTTDSSGNGHTGTMSNFKATDWVPGVYGSGLRFETNYEIDTGSSFDLANSSFTVEGWIKRKTSGHLDVLIGNNGGSNNEALWLGYDDSTDRLNIDFFNNSLFSDLSFTDTGWHHIACTFDSSNKARKLYRDGVLVGSDTSSSNMIGTSNLLLGHIVSGNFSLDGHLDDVRIYNYARTQKQIIEDMNNDAPNGASPLLYYDFDEGTGSTTHNLGFGSSALDGSIAGASWTTSGKYNKAFNFDGSDDYLNAGSDSALDNLSTVTISAWINPSTFGEGNFGRIIDKGTHSTTATEGRAFFITNDGTHCTNCLSFFQNFGAVNYGWWDTPNNTISTNTWQHVVVTYDRTSASNIPSMYINGILQTIVTYNAPSGTASNDSSTNLLIGNRTETDRTFNGILDEVKIYSFALTADEIRQEYNAGFATRMGAISTASDGITPDNSTSREFCIPGDTSTCNPPVGYWKLDENSGTTTNDSSGNNLTGSFSSNPKWTSGKSGTALDFDGNNDYLTVAKTSIINDLTKYTWEAWIFPTLNDAEFVMAKSSQDKSLLRYADGRLRQLTAASIGNADSTSLNTIPLNTWTHVTATYDDTATSRVVKLYINGTEVEYDSQSVASGTLNTDNDTDLYLGSINPSGNQMFQGKIDDVRIYNYARTPAQIAWDMNQGAPVAQYDFDECTGTVLHDTAPKADRSISPLNGTITIDSGGTQASAGSCSVNASTAWYNGRNGKYSGSLNFDATDDYVTVPDNDAFSFGDSTTDRPFSVSAWVYPINARNRIIVAKNDETGGTEQREFNLFYDVGSTISFELTDNSNGLKIGRRATTNPPSTDTWHLITATYDGSATNAGVKIYVDGIRKDLFDIGAGGYVSMHNTTASLMIGYYVGSSSIPAKLFTGQIDDVRIYNYPLTPTQIKNLYNNSSAVSF